MVLDFLTELSIKSTSNKLHFPTSLAIECKFEGTEDLGLTAEVMQDEENIVVTIKGKPKQAGDFNLTLSYKYKEWIDGEEPLTLTIPVAFNATLVLCGRIFPHLRIFLSTKKTSPVSM